MTVPMPIPACCLPLILLLAAGLFASPLPAAADEFIEELVVTSQRRALSLLEVSSNLARLDREDLEQVRHQHVHQIMTRVPGVWVGRGSGQEHLTAIRSPVLTGAGSCGAFLYLEDSVPIRPAGFCNVNALLEIDTDQAESIEVIRGPGNALYGSNALHGIINVLQSRPGTPGYASLQLGSNEYRRAALGLPWSAAAPWTASLAHTDDGGFRDATGFRQTKARWRYHRSTADGELSISVSATDLDQETAGFILGEYAYRDPALNRSNPNPEAFRRADSQRIVAHLSKALGNATLDLRPYLRRSDMEFLQHFLPGQPLEANGHDSAGLISVLHFAAAGFDASAGVDLEWASIFLRETQDQPTTGSAFLVATRPQGKHYDYVVDSVGAAPYLQLQRPFGDAWHLEFGLRLDYLRYDYDNRMLDGNTRDDGTACGFGGCLYTRPADRSDSFFNVAPKLSLRRALSSQSVAFASLARGFRAPQATELYRLQSGQAVADLDSEKLDSVELGLRRLSPRLSAEASLYYLNKRNSVFRDADGFNVSGARSRHYGVEADISWALTGQILAALNISYARHRYDFNRTAARGETFVSGRDVDTAPRLLANARLQFQPHDAVSLFAEWSKQGNYYVDAENRFRYPGHSLLNLGARFDLNDSFTMALNLNNATDRVYADRADFAFGNYRYFPGRGREFFAEILYTRQAAE